MIAKHEACLRNVGPEQDKGPSCRNDNRQTGGSEGLSQTSENTLGENSLGLIRNHEPVLGGPTGTVSKILATSAARHTYCIRTKMFVEYLAASSLRREIVVS